MYYITILDYANVSVDQYDLAKHLDKTTLAHWQAEDFEEFITSEGYRSHNIWRWFGFFLLWFIGFMDVSL